MTTAVETATDVLCEIRNVSHDFLMPNGAKLRVLENVNVAIKPSEVVALLGPSGCGKSTILRVMAGLIVPTEGEVFYRGQRVNGLTPGVGIVFQSFALYPWMTVTENVEIVLEAVGLPSGERKVRAEKAIRTVGLVGFEEAYPRELSGGMKQRLGIARALSVNPEFLFMDEPFSHVDALTAEGLRAEVIDLWEPEDTNPSSILMVSHDIKEVVYMADRIIVLSSHPGRVRTIVENRLPRPRDMRARPFEELVDYLHEIITGAEMPDAPAATAAATREGRVEPLPRTSTSEVVGLLEYLDSKGGADDIFDVAADTDREFGQVMRITKAAEMLNFVDTPKQGVVLTADGRRFVQADTESRKPIWREQLLKLRLFQDVHSLLQREGGEVNGDMVREMIILALPRENYEEVFETMVRWARFGNLFAYEDGADRLSLQ